jgi:hypothetical protein
MHWRKVPAKRTVKAFYVVVSALIVAVALTSTLPWAIKVEDVAVFAVRKRSVGPVTPNPAQPTFEFQ